jgi:Acyl-coenzyme A:6-aminopenicillanic acid acyl-transferase
MALRVDERIVSGGDGEDILVHHLALRGSNRSIGRHLGEIARGRYHMLAPRAADGMRSRVQREWLGRNAPILFERMRGVADAFGVDLRDDGYDLSRLGCPPAQSGCSALFVPPRRGRDGHPLVSRAFDFDGPLPAPAPGEAPAASRPYVVEMHPDEGLPSLALCAFDLLGGALDGVNGEGLAVVAASDVESATAAPLEPEDSPVGLDELQLVRHVLDSCATAVEAREALLAAKHHYAAYPAHWLVADRHGDAFVFEVGRGRNRVHVVEAEGLPLVATNHPLHRYREEAPPREDGPACTYSRWRRMCAGFAEAPERIDAAELTRIAERAFFQPDAAAKTVWHGVYDLRERALEATFLLHSTAAERTAPIRFELG